MGDKLNNAIADLQYKHNFANLKEEYNYVNEVNKAIQALESGGGGEGVSEQFVNDAVQVETDARVLADEALQDNIDSIAAAGVANYYDKTATDAKFITKTDGASAIEDLVTNTELATALDTSSTFTAKDPSNGDAVTALDTILANIYTAPVRQATLSNEQTKQMEGNILAELLKKMAK